jgi:arginine deiminase
VPRLSGVDSEVGRLRAERNVATQARLERIGIDVITVPGSELCGSRDGPRSLCCP